MMDTLQPVSLEAKQSESGCTPPKKIGFHDADYESLPLQVEISLCAVKMQSTVKKLQRIPEFLYC